MCAIYSDRSCYGPPCPWSLRHITAVHISPRHATPSWLPHTRTQKPILSAVNIFMVLHYPRKVFTALHYSRNVRHCRLLLVTLIFTSLSAVFRRFRNSGVVQLFPQLSAQPACVPLHNFSVVSNVFWGWYHSSISVHLLFASFIIRYRWGSQSLV